MAPIRFALVMLATIVSQVTAAPLMYPRGDSAIGNEVAVSASGGVVKSDTKELASQTANNNYQNNYAATTTTTPMAKETNMMKDSTTTKMMMEDTTTKMMMEDTTTKMMDATTTTEMAKETATTTMAAQYTTPMYGSGYSYWGGKGYNNCVQQCLAKFGQPAATYTASPVQETGTPTSSGSGTTHTVIVAPTQGVLRYVPFAVNASIGDTVRFVWGAGPHTVTKSSALNPCNKSLDASFFTSGPQNKSFTFDQVVNDTTPTFFYCTVPNHCQKGMFGIINPPNADPVSVNSTTTVGSYMQTMIQTDSSMAALWSYVSNKTAGTSAENWGMSMDISQMPESQYSALAQNAMYTQLFYASNPGLLETGTGASGSDIVIPSDITATLQNLAAAQPATSTYESVPAAQETITDAATATAVPANAANASPDNGSSYGNSSGRLTTSTVMVAVIAMLASFIVL